MFAPSWLLLAAIALSGVSNAAPKQGTEHVVHEARAATGQDNWARTSRVEERSILPLRIGLTQTSLDKIDDMLMELSHPSSPRYGQWMSTEDVHDVFAPAAETVDAVKEWLHSAGIANERITHSDNKGWIALDVTVEEAEDLLKTTFHEYEHASSDYLMIGAEDYSIPKHLVPHIDFVTPGAKLVPIRKTNVLGRRSNTHGKRGASHRVRPGVAADCAPGGSTSSPATPESGPDPALAGCWYNNTVTCLRAMYHIPATPPAVDGNSLGVFETGYYFNQPDLDASFQSFASWVPNGTQPIPALIDGGQYNTSPNTSGKFMTEALVDIFVATALIYPQNVTLYQVDDRIYAAQDYGNPDVGSFNTFLDALDGSYCTYSAFGETGNNSTLDASYPNPDPAGYQGQLMCGVFKPTKVISLSYGTNEVSLPPNYQKRQCLEFAKLGMMGVSILSASGDDGVAAFHGSIKNNTNGCFGPKNNIFSPTYPSNCPYVTSVGATQLYDEQTIDTPESVMNYLDTPDRNFSSGGGFSNLYERPDYQKDAVQRYLDNYDPGYPSYSELNPDFSKVQGMYNRIGRAMPDVSANGLWMLTTVNGLVFAISGTSVSAPIFASIITLLNQERALVGKDSMGFLNPVFYAHPGIFNDIVNGTNYGCGTNGFPARPGWDPSAGLGTPDYNKMRELFLSL